MIVTRDYITEDGRHLVLHESDRGLYIIQDQTGAVYDKAIDVPGIGYTYTESEDPIADGPGEIPE